MATSPLQAEQDTIAAIATAPGRGGIGVIRLSGTLALTIAKAICNKTALTARHAHYGVFYGEDDSIIDDGLVLFFPGPASFTGEDVIELQGHGGPVVLSTLLSRCLALGARQARPGEFSERAFLNDKLDLVQAEAIADLINAHSQSAARQARASLNGVFSNAIGELVRLIVELRVYVEAAIDFPEEEVDFLSEGHVEARLLAIIAQAKTLRQRAHEGAVIRDGVNVVLAGRPNAGKSSLLNALSGNDVAIVTDQPGTTRDVIQQHIELDGIPLYLSDTAGLRDSDDQVELEGIKRAHKALADADLVLHLIDDQSEDASALSLPEEHGTVIKVLTKTDLSGRSSGLLSDALNTVAISSKTGDGLPELKLLIAQVLGLTGPEQSRFSARQRHIRAIDRALVVLNQAYTQFMASGAGELLAEDLRSAHDQLGEITGKMSSDELLGEIFSSFCIGK